MTSAFCVWLVKKKLNTPCGHMGTLDPMASGVLPVGVGQATRLFNYQLDKEKKYVALFTFGAETDTLDATGKVVKTTEKIPTLEEIKGVLPQFIGEIMQVPPNYSAKCVNGKRGYELARAGKEFSLPAKKVTILDIAVSNTQTPNVFSFEITCMGGTYIRSLCRDIALKVGSFAYMSALERTKAGIFEKQNSVHAEELKNIDDFEKILIPSDKVVSFEKLILTKKQAKRLLDGLYDTYDLPDGFYRVYNETEFWGVGKIENGLIKMKSYVRG